MKRPSLEFHECLVDGLQLHAPELLGEDRLAWQQCSLSGHCAIGLDRWYFKEMDIRCDAGHVKLDGAVSAYR